MKKIALNFLFLLLLIGCSQKSTENDYSSLNLEGFSDEKFEQNGVFIDPDSKLAKETTNVANLDIIRQTDDTRTYLIGSGIFRQPKIDESNGQIYYDSTAIPVLILFHENIYQDLRGGVDMGPILSNGITIMESNGAIIKSIAVSAEHLKFKGEPILVFTEK